MDSTNSEFPTPDEHTTVCVFCDDTFEHVFLPNVYQLLVDHVEEEHPEHYDDICERADEIVERYADS